MEAKDNKKGWDWIDFLAYNANRIVCIISSIIFIVLVWWAFRYTQYVAPLGWEFSQNIPDSMKRNILFLGLAIVFFLGLFYMENRLSESIKNVIVRVSLIIALVWTGGVGMWWITVLERHPEGDQAFVYGAASYFLEGSYTFLEAGNYCGKCPHQLPLIFMLEILFSVVGVFNYYAFQVICVGFAMGIVYMGYRLVRCITSRTLLAVGYCLMMICCLPLIFYTGWVYGDIPSTFMILLVANLLYSYSKKQDWKYLVGIVVGMTLAIMFRQNSLIALIGLCLVGGVYTIQKKDKKLFVALLAAIACPILVTSAINKMYEIRSGFEHSDGFPASSYISMGLQEEYGKYGWYSLYCSDLYFSVDCDTERADELARKEIGERLEYMEQNPQYARNFFSQKLQSQWNAPLYQGMYFATKYWPGYEAEEGTFVDQLSKEYFPTVLSICDRLQMIVFFGMLCYCLLAVRKDSNIMQHLIVVTIIGGFFFSIIWEAKSRYILPYYLMMFPLTVIGYEKLFEKVLTIVALFWRKNKI